MIVTYWRGFWKKRNSTAVPVEGDGVSIDVQLKHPSSFTNPVFIFSSANAAGYLEVDYVRAWNRYYYVTDTTLENAGVCTVTCTTDVLGSYRTQIGAYNAFVSRASHSAAFNTMINDVSISSSYATVGNSEVTGTTFPGMSSTGGCYLLRTSGQNTTGSGVGITTYAINSGAIKDVLNFLFTDSNYDFLSDTSIKSFFNPFQYIIDCQWTPFNASRFGSKSGPICLGWWQSGVSAMIVEAESFGFGEDLILPSSVYTDYRAYSADFTEVTIYLPGAGLFYLNPANFSSSNKLHYRYNIDVATGECLIEVSVGVYNIASYTGKMFAPVQLGQVSMNVLGAAGSSVSAISKLMGGNVLGATSDVIEGVKNVLQPVMSVNGTMGNITAIMYRPFVKVSRFDYASGDIPQNVAGRPAKKMMRIRDIPGYIQCEKASLEVGGPVQEREQVNSFLNGGFYYE